MLLLLLLLPAGIGFKVSDTFTMKVGVVFEEAENAVRSAAAAAAAAPSSAPPAVPAMLWLICLPMSS
jgi:hypothetical protein